jgi:hypothetical protein
VERWIPEQGPRIRALLAWYGCCEKWNGYLEHESIPPALPLEFPTDAIVAAIESAPLSERESEGAARSFCATEFRSDRPGEALRLPLDLRRRLLEHVLRGGDQNEIDRARSVLGVLRGSNASARRSGERSSICADSILALDSCARIRGTRRCRPVRLDLARTVHARTRSRVHPRTDGLASQVLVDVGIMSPRGWVRFEPRGRCILDLCRFDSGDRHLCAHSRTAAMPSGAPRSRAHGAREEAQSGSSAHRQPWRRQPWRRQPRR